MLICSCILLFWLLRRWPGPNKDGDDEDGDDDDDDDDSQDRIGG